MNKLLSAVVLAVASWGAAGRADAGPLVFGLTTGNQLFTFDADTPQSISAFLPITGLGGDTIVGIDFRPASGQLIGVGQSAGGFGIVYDINPNTGAATPVVNGFPLTGTAFGVDFNPVPDALRIVSNTGQNLRITGFPTGNFQVNVDGNINPGNPGVVGSAYTNNFAGATTTTLYALASGTDQLFIQSPPNDGTLVLVGSLGVNTNDLVGFDIAGPGPNFNTAFASLTPEGASGSSFYTIDLSTGAATLIGSVGGGNVLVRGIAIAPIPEPGTLALAGIGALGLIGYARRRRQTG